MCDVAVRRSAVVMTISDERIIAVPTEFGKVVLKL